MHRGQIKCQILPKSDTIIASTAQHSSFQTLIEKRTCLGMFIGKKGAWPCIRIKVTRSMNRMDFFVIRCH